MKVVAVDNLDRMDVSDVVLEEGLTPEQADYLASRMNIHNPDGDRFFVVRPDDYKPYKFKP